MKLNYNVDEVQDSGGFVPLPPGEYKCKIIEAHQKASQQGNWMLALTLQVEDEKYAGTKIFDNVVYTVDWKVKQFLMAKFGRTFGGNFPDVPVDAEDNPVEAEADKYIGASVTCATKQEPDNTGVLRSRVARYMPLTEAASPAAAASQATGVEPASKGSKPVDFS